MKKESKKIQNKYVDFVSDNHFLDCVKWVCDAYPAKNAPLDMKRFTRNSLDVFKMIFDIINGEIDVNQWIRGEIIRQDDKTISNRIGDFHQMLLGGISGWENLGRGHPLGIDLKKKDNTIFIELKNKHNTVKGEDHKNVFDKLKEVLRQNPTSKVYYAYIIPKKPGHGERVWKPSQRIPNNQILEAWGSHVYEIVTGDITSLEKTWKALPIAIKDICKNNYEFSSADMEKLIKFFKSTLNSLTP